MTKKRDDLKERLKALRVNEPLKLSGEMKPPVERKEVPQKEAPPIEVAQKKDAQSKLSQKEQVEPVSRVHGEAPHFESARCDVPQRELAHNGAPQVVVTSHEPPQNKPAQFEAASREVASQGFFKLSHSVFAEPLLRELSGDCFRLFLWLSSRAWRYPTSGGQVRASVGYIEIHAGMSHATISRGLKTLKEKGLIAIVEVDFKNGNLWQVSAIACGHPNSDDKPPRGKAPQNEAAQLAEGGASKQGGHSLKTREWKPQIEQDLRSSKKVKKFKEVAAVVVQLPELEVDGFSESGEDLLQHFETELGGEERTKFVNDFMAREYPHGFLPPMRVVQSLAARDWFKQSRLGVRSVAC